MILRPLLNPPGTTPEQPVRGREQDGSRSQFARQLRLARELNGATQAELARAALMHASAIAHMEAGRREPSLAVLRRLSAALGVRADFLLGLTAPREAAAIPPARWMLEFAQRWSAGKDETSVKALAWNINGAFREWSEEAAREGSQQPDCAIDGHCREFGCLNPDDCASELAARAGPRVATQVDVEGSREENPLIPKGEA